MDSLTLKNLHLIQRVNFANLHNVIIIKAVILIFVLTGVNSLALNPTPESVKSLPVLKKLGIGPCADATIHNGYLYVIGKKQIYSFNISFPENPVLLDSLSGLGNVRQIEAGDGFAYVTSREEGLFVIDIRNPRKMVKAAHYDTVELGTGIAVSGQLAAVANRQYGVEFIDISHPENPTFMGMTLTGEAQSVFIKDTLAFVGDWGPREMVICHISNPGKPPVSYTHLRRRRC